MILAGVDAPLKVVIILMFHCRFDGTTIVLVTGVGRWLHTLFRSVCCQNILNIQPDQLKGHGIPELGPLGWLNQYGLPLHHVHHFLAFSLQNAIQID